MLPLHSSLCIFIPALLYDASLEEIETFGRMAQALRQTWLTNSSFVVLPEKGAEPPGHLATKNLRIKVVEHRSFFGGWFLSLEYSAGFLLSKFCL